MAPPTGLTEELLKRLVNEVTAGVPVKTAFASEGVERKRAWRWLKNGQDRPGSIYGALRQQLVQAVAKATVNDVVIITNASTRPSRRVTTVTKSEARRDGNQVVMEETEQTVTVVEIPPDPKWAAWKVERREKEFRLTHQVEAAVGVVPADVMARTLGEKLRQIQGGDGPTLLQEGDDEARLLMGS